MKAIFVVGILFFMLGGTELIALVVGRDNANRAAKYIGHGMFAPFQSPVNFLIWLIVLVFGFGGCWLFVQLAHIQ